MSDSYGRINRWRLSLSSSDFIVTYCLGLKKQVPNALYRCTPDHRDDAEVDDGIHTFEAHALVMTQSQAAGQEGEEEEKILEEEVDLNDVWDKLSDHN